MADENPVVFASRKQIIAEYQKNNEQFVATTRPYKSVIYFTWEIVNAAAGGVYAVLRQNTTVEWFGYGKGDQIPVIPQAQLFKVATDSDTNQSRGRRTNGVEDFCIEGISATAKETRIRYLTTDIPVTVTDVDVIQAYLGGRSLVDPGLIISPAQESSPFNLEALLYEALKPNCAIQFVWDRRNFIPIGTLDQIPEGGAKSYLHASGQPSTDNRYKIPEGYIWRRTDKPDGDFAVQGQITDSVVVPINPVTLPGGAAATPPQFLVQAVAMRLHGLGLGQPGQNVG
jgi:hypothetical protein